MLNELGIKPEHECFDVGHVGSLAPLIDMGVLSEPLHVDFVMGVVGGIPATARNVAAMADNVPPGSHWGVIGISRQQWLVVAAALTLGGSIRVGLEDNFYLPDGTMARSNGDLSRRRGDDRGRRPDARHGRAGAGAARAAGPRRGLDPMLQNLRDSRRASHALRRAAAHRPAVPGRRARPISTTPRAGAARRAAASHDRRPAAHRRARAAALRAGLVRRPARRDLDHRRGAAPGEPAQRRARRLQPLALRDPRRDDRRDRRRARRAGGAAGAGPLHRGQGPHRPAGRRSSTAGSACRTTSIAADYARSAELPALDDGRGDREAAGRARRQRARAARTCSRRGRSGSSTRWRRCARTHGSAGRTCSPMARGPTTCGACARSSWQP